MKDDTLCPAHILGYRRAHPDIAWRRAKELRDALRYNIKHATAGTYCVFRGESFDNGGPAGFWWAYCNFIGPRDRYIVFGFRCARTA